LTAEEVVLDDSVDDLFENAPCGYLATTADGTIVRVNKTLEELTGFDRAELLDGRRFQDLLAPGGRIYYETHLAPLLRMQGAVREIAVELILKDQSRLPALINSTLRSDDSGRPDAIRTTVFGASDRRHYERELLSAQRREREIADALQRSLLSGELPTAPELKVEVAYNASERGLDVGGDWYDAFWLQGDTRAVGLVVGDVVGRGLHAAATMGQLRSAVRALASTGLEPGPLLQSLDGYVARHRIGQMTTLVYAELDLDRATLRYACAGHPPPLILSANQAPALLWDGRSAPMDSQPNRSVTRPQASVHLTPGSTVLLYTDGLVERRSRPEQDGLETLLATVAPFQEEGPEGLLAKLVSALADPDDPDDVCLLVARLGEVGGGAGPALVSDTPD
jgi:sigma-B regulation protein RsbU (phosphoserine phosphatase)